MEGKGTKSEGIFRDSLVQNVRDLVGVLPAFNLAGSAELDAITARMEAELCAHDAEELRTNDKARAATAEAAASILAQVGAFIS